MPTPRRDFLSWLGAGGALAAAGGFPARPDARHDVPVSDKWDMGWCDRLNGKARAVFDSPELSGGAAVYRAQLWRDQQREVYGTPATELSAVVVIRHAAIPLVMDDAYWQRFEIGKAQRLRDPQGKKWTRVNPVGVPQPGASTEDAANTLRSFLDSGGIVLACNLAFGMVVERFRTADKLSADAARATAINHLISGVILQPSGIFAVLRAQQAGCSYLLAS